jgi:ADP-ribose pyrophosphatase
VTESDVVESRRVYTGRVLGLRVDSVRMSDGAVAEREVVDHPGSVVIVALDDAQQVVLVNQYRHPVGRRLDELPAGLLDVDGEPPLEAARRELAEEAGLAASDWQVLVDLHTSPGFTDESVRVFLARGLSPERPEGFEAEHEELTLSVRRVPLAEAVRMALAGELMNAAAVAGVLAAAHAAADGWRGLRPPDAPWPSRSRR